MDQGIRIPHNQTALMQYFQRLASTGHVYWCGDQIERQKLPNLIDKWSHYALRADAPARAYRKSVGKAGVLFCLSPAFVQDDSPDTVSPKISWWMLSTMGKGGLADGLATPGKVADLRTEAGRLRLNDYELLQQNKTFRSAGKSKTQMTWTWRLRPERYKAWEAFLIKLAKTRDIQGMTTAHKCLLAMPMFSGVRYQVIRLIAEGNKMLKKMGLAPIKVPTLPIMLKLPLWAKDADGALLRV